MEELAPAIAVPSIFFAFGWMLKAFFDHRTRMKLPQLQADVHMRVLDGFSSAQEISTYMESTAGKKLLETSQGEE